MDETTVRDTIRSYVLREFLSADDRDALGDDTELISTGVINSLGLIRLVAFLEKEFSVKIESNEMNAEYLGTVAKVVRLVLNRMG